MPPLTKTCPKMVLSHKGGSLCVKDAFAKKFFGAGRDSAGGARACDCGSGRPWLLWMAAEADGRCGVPLLPERLSECEDVACNAVRSNAWPTSSSPSGHFAWTPF